MKIKLDRKYKKEGYTIGKLSIDGVYFCDTLEDTDRGLLKSDNIAVTKEKKIKGKTAIPRGTYRVTLSVQSPKYKTYTQYKWCNGYLPRLINVPAYDGILIHIGNTASDTDGCILVGKNKAVGKVLESTVTFKLLYERLKKAADKGEEIYITIE